VVALNNPSPTATPSAKSIRDLVPQDLGGIIARRGFAFQDHVTAKFCLDMLLGDQILEVWCETYDDIVLIWQESTFQVVEFVQVKKENLDQLWSPSTLCQRKDRTLGTSILEKNLSRDCCREAVRFRLCTSLPPNDVLNPLTLPVTHSDRQSSTEVIKKIAADLAGRIGTFESANRHGTDFWISNVVWEHATEDGIRDHNRVLLHRLLEANQIPAYCDTVESLYDNLLWKVKSAAEADWQQHKAQKMLKRGELLQWLLATATPLPNLTHEERLIKKLRDAGMDDVAVESAKVLRRQYTVELRQPRYLDTKSISFYSDQVPVVLHRLRSELDSGRRQENGSVFHHTCIESVMDISRVYRSEVADKPPDGFLLGCMYEVTARCRHRFIQANP